MEQSLICPSCNSSNTYKKGWTPEGCQRYKCRDCGRRFTTNTAQKTKKSFSRIDGLKQFLKNSPRSIEEISDRFNAPPKVIREQLKLLKDDKYNIVENNNEVEIRTELSSGTKHLRPELWQGDTIRFGLVSDNHLCNYNSREDVLNALYDIFASEGVDTVFNCGNWIDGECSFNKNELNTRGLTKQIEYAVEYYPYREGMKTKFIAGDDHEGWYSQREGINIGEYFQMKREQAGKFDLEYLGYTEADILLSEEGQSESWMRLIHAGGGTAYALSYTSQKLAESYQGGEKPKVLLIGHYHKLGYEFPREIHCIQAGTTEDQSLFMRKKKIQAMVGGVIVTLRRSKDGIINRCLPDFITFFDKKFYIGQDKYWK